MKKYLLTKETKQIHGITLHRIKALVDIERYGVEAGNLGGFVQTEDNLSQDGDAWVGEEANVYGNATVYGNAIVYGYASVYGNAKICGNASVCGDASVSDYVMVTDNAKIYGNARVYGNVAISGNAMVTENAKYALTGNSSVQKKTSELLEKYSDDWILCSKRMPEYFETVLVTPEDSCKGFSHELRSLDIGYFTKLKFFGACGNYEIDDIIAWQPLPVPYPELYHSKEDFY